MKICFLIPYFCYMSSHCIPKRVLRRVRDEYT